MVKKIITTKNGNKYLLLPPSYADEVNATPLSTLYRVPMICQIANCGYIICHYAMNEHFGVYEPCDNEFELNEVYNQIKK